MKRILTFVVVLFFISSITSSDDIWIEFFEGDRHKIIINKSSIRTVDDSLFILEKYILKNPPKGVYPCTIRYTEVNCKSLMFRTLNSKYYKDKSCSIFGDENTKITDWKYNNPGTLSNSQREIQCEGFFSTIGK